MVESHVAGPKASGGQPLAPTLGEAATGGLRRWLNGVLFASPIADFPGDIVAAQRRLDARAYSTLVRSAAAANFNMMRVWGGGIYPPDVFYDACDEAGILLYHDLQFARGDLPQPLPAAANASILAEVSHQVRRLAHHPSIILYDSNNEDVVQPSGPTAWMARSLPARKPPCRSAWGTISVASA